MNAWPTKEPNVWCTYLTFRCNFNCTYCIQKHGKHNDDITPGAKRKIDPFEELTGEQWLKGFASIPVRPQHELILSGGEPSMHPDFYDIVVGAAGLGYNVEITSNLSFIDPDTLISRLDAENQTVKRLFCTYNPAEHDKDAFLNKISALNTHPTIREGAQVAYFAHNFPHAYKAPMDPREWDSLTNEMIATLRSLGVGVHPNTHRRAEVQGKFFNKQKKWDVACNSGWMLFAPDGSVWNCDAKLLNRYTPPFGNITDIENLTIPKGWGHWFPCAWGGHCNPCHVNGHGEVKELSGLVGPEYLE